MLLHHGYFEPCLTACCWWCSSPLTLATFMFFGPTAEAILHPKGSPGLRFPLSHVKHKRVGSCGGNWSNVNKLDFLQKDLELYVFDVPHFGYDVIFDSYLVVFFYLFDWCFSTNECWYSVDILDTVWWTKFFYMNCPSHVLPRKPRWNLKITPLKRKLIFQTSILGFQLLVFGSVFFTGSWEIKFHQINWENKFHQINWEKQISPKQLGNQIYPN